MRKEAGMGVKRSKNMEFESFSHLFPSVPLTIPTPSVILPTIAVGAAESETRLDGDSRGTVIRDP
jgi:hypothetical protein